MNAADLRRTFLRFFEERGHTAVPSGSLVPPDDPTLFFVNAGMVPFKDVFTGQEQRPYTRATSVQKCMRVSGKHNDLENVGFTARHHTFFEMLGNFSFGDYFKEEAIDYAWTFLTETMSLPSDRLLITVFEDDDESAELWKARGVQPDRIGRCGEKDNFWSMGPTGPCGPCTEIHWDLQEDFVPDNEPDPWGFGEDAGRFMEIWNLVFMQYERYEENGGIQQRDLPRPSVDTGMGFERLVAIVQGHKSNWEADEFQSIIARAGGIAGIGYGEDTLKDQSLKVIADHSRAAAFLVGDGVMPSNEERGYVLRRIMRRAIRHGVNLGIQEPFLHETADQVVDLMSETYPELKERREFIRKVVHNEETAFRETLNRGLHMLDGEFSSLEEGGESQLSGKTIFILHDTFGFPPDLTGVIADERGFSVDIEGYEQHMNEQRERSRASWKGASGNAAVSAFSLSDASATEFTGYGATAGESTILALLVDGQPSDGAEAGTQVELLVAETPFYAESGGQIGDTGRITSPSGALRVVDCQQAAGGLTAHHALVESGSVAVGETVRLEVDAERRRSIMRNHTATHLLHAGLRQLLGEHVQQKGSLVDPDRFRFDFSHFEAIPRSAIVDLEDLCNEQVLANNPLEVFETSMEEASQAGAMALFGEKYGDQVRVVRVPGFSTELCGGTHVASTGEIGQIKVVSEGGIAAGIRRVEALTGRGAFEYLRNLEDQSRAIGAQLKTSGSAHVDKITRMLEEQKALRREIDELKKKLVSGGADGGPQARQVAGVPVLATVIDGASGKELRGHGDVLLDKIGEGVVVLGARDGNKASLLVKVSASLTDRLHAGNLVSELAPIVDGRGGGRPDMAQAGGKKPEGLTDAMDKAYELIGSALA
ncbi:MAG: alanine--tRNA ligase [Myxococcota bacterium]|nr:alanine--tRNA ligase [Myxococcota bacterium]